MGHPYLFMRDGARRYITHDTVEFLSGRIPKLLMLDQWPPYSPDLNPLNYSIWSVHEVKVYRGRIITDIEPLKEAIIYERKRLPQENINDAIDAFPTRLVLEIDGGHIEHYICNFYSASFLIVYVP